MARFPLTEEEKRRGLRYANPGEQIRGPHVLQMPDGRRVMNPAGTLGNALNGRPEEMGPPVAPTAVAPVAPGPVSSGQWAVGSGMAPGPVDSGQLAVGSGMAPAAPVAGRLAVPEWARAAEPVAAPMPVRTDDEFNFPRGAGNMFMTEGKGLLPAPANPYTPPKYGSLSFTRNDGSQYTIENNKAFNTVPVDGQMEVVPSNNLVRQTANFDRRVPDSGPVVPRLVAMPGMDVRSNRLTGMQVRMAAGDWDRRDAAIADEARMLPPAAPTTDQWARTANAIGGFRAPEMTRADAGIQADLAATRTERWNQRGSTTNVDRRLEQKRSQGAALDALTRQTDEQIRVAQGTPQAVASSGGVASYTPAAGGQGPGTWSETVRPEAQGGSALRHPSGITQDQARRLRMRALPKQKGQIPDWVRMQIATQTPEQQRVTLALWDRDDPGDPETVAAMEPILQWFDQQGQAAGGTTGTAGAGGGQGTVAPAAGAQGAKPIRVFR